MGPHGRVHDEMPWELCGPIVHDLGPEICLVSHFEPGTLLVVYNRLWGFPRGTSEIIVRENYPHAKLVW